MNISEIRSQYPQYADLSDDQLGKALHAKFYADMPYGEFAQKAGIVKPVETDDPGALGAFAIGGGRMLDRMAAGLEQGFQGARSAFGSEGAKQRLAQMQTEQAENDRHYANLQRQRPVASTLGEIAPILPFGLAGAGALGIAAMSAIPGLVEYGTPEEKATRAGLGAAAATGGALLGKMAGRVLQPTRDITQAQTRAMDAADRLGVKLTAGEASGNRAMKWAEGASADLPFASGIAQNRSLANARAMSRAAASSIGQKADEITPAVLSDARAAIGAEYDRILGNAKIPLDQTFRQEVSGITGSKVMKELRDESTEALLAQFKNMPQGKVSVSGEWFQQNKTALDRAISAAYSSGQTGKAKALESFEDALDRAVMRSLPADDKAAYKAAQRQWASLRLLETGKVIDEGRVMPGRLDQALASRYKGAYKEGKLQGPLPDIAALSGTLRSPQNSGTMARAAYTGGLAGSAFFEPALALGAIAAPTALQAVSPALRNYMTRGLLTVSPELEAQLMRSGGLLGLPAAATY